METTTINYGLYSYRVYAKKRDPHGVIWDGYYDILDKEGDHILRGGNMVTTLDVLTSAEAACRLAEVVVRAKIDNAIGGQDGLLGRI
ncbi:hypothetical protein [Propionivibrio soli]|uniref:hypothetical protein n=1 Tax=Propionivibrio soli TaxID=2976531 RepID=UPI0021E80DE1|nr:hypothetical protein [Propionivibrio soli]